VDDFSEADLGAELTEARVTIENLHIALNSCRRIGAAVGILMATVKVTEDAAFDLLRSASQTTHRKLRDVADQVVLTGAL
jgi:AmiR/NasT family two-component response regulator